jgi:hypothetical protein
MAGVRIMQGKLDEAEGLLLEVRGVIGSLLSFILFSSFVCHSPIPQL